MILYVVILIAVAVMVVMVVCATRSALYSPTALQSRAPHSALDNLNLQSNDTYLGVAELPSGRYLLYGQSNRKRHESFMTFSSTRTRFKEERHIARWSTDDQNVGHNLYVLSTDDSRRLGSGVFAIGGQFKAGQNKFTGIHLVQLLEHEKRWVVVRKLVDGHHPGCIELRPNFNDVCEFDGWSTMVWFRGEWRLYCRRNAGASGYRALQTCRAAALSQFGSFEQVHIRDHVDADDIYFMHAYALPDQSAILGLVPVAFNTRKDRRSGIYATISHDGVNFGPLVHLHTCDTHEKRTADLPVAGITWLDERHFEYAVHRGVRGRVPNSPPQHVTWHTAYVPEHA